jgi:hypothetical protein
MKLSNAEDLLFAVKYSKHTAFDIGFRMFCDC